MAVAGLAHAALEVHHLLAAIFVSWDI